MKHFRTLAALVPIWCVVVNSGVWGKPPQPTPQNYVMESADLRVEVSANYAYRIIEKSTGNVLLSQNQTSFTIGNVYTATGIRNVSLGAGSLSGTLDLVAGGNKKTTALVNFSFTSPDALRIALSRPAGMAAATSVGERFSSAGENYYGAWEAAYTSSTGAVGIDNRGISHAFSGKEVISAPDNGVFAASARAPFYMTSRKIGIYAPTTATGQYAFAASAGANTSFSFNAPSLRYNVYYGQTPKQILGQYNAQAGPAAMPPDWALGTIWWRDDSHSDAVARRTSAQALLLDDADRLQGYGIPASAMWIDRPYGTNTNPATPSGIAYWGNMDLNGGAEWFPDPDAMVQQLDARGLKTMLWIANKAANGLLTEGSANNYLFTTSAEPAVDLRNPAAYAWFQGKLDTLMGQALLADGSTGIKGYKIDRGGEGEMPESLTNQLIPIMDQLAYEGMQARNGNDFFMFTRNANDTSRRYAAIWNGDADSTFQGLSTTLVNGLRCGLMNFPVWGSDVGGYRSGTPTKELFARWMGLGAYSPMMEILQRNGRTIWLDYDKTAPPAGEKTLLEITQKMTREHQQLIPYTRSNIYAAVQTGVPVMRALPLEFPDDPAVAGISNEYMYGPSLLVAPIVTASSSPVGVAKTTTRTVYLPAGNWMDYNNKMSVYAGRQTIAYTAPLDVVPVFVREGAIIPRGDILKGNNPAPNWAPSLQVEFFPSDRVASSFEYYTGSGVSLIRCTPQTGGYLVELGDLGAGGELDLYLRETGADTLGLTLNGLELLRDQQYWYAADTHLLRVPFEALDSTTLVIAGAIDLWPDGTAFQAVPEPGAVMLLACGALGLACRRRPRLSALVNRRATGGGGG